MTCACPTCGKPLDFEGYRLEAEAGIVIGGGKFAALTRRETAIFELLWTRPGRVFTRSQIFDDLYSLLAGDGPEEKILDVYICKLRKKLNGLGLSIETVWGAGYRLQKGVEHE